LVRTWSHGYYRNNVRDVCYGLECIDVLNPYFFYDLFVYHIICYILTNKKISYILVFINNYWNNIYKYVLVCYRTIKKYTYKIPDNDPLAKVLISVKVWNNGKHITNKLGEKMDPFQRRYNKRLQKSPFDFFNGDEYEWILHEMQSMTEDIYFIEMFQKILRHELRVSKRFTYGLSTNVLPVWSPKIQEINPNSLKTGNKELIIFKEGERLIDITEGDEEVAVTIEIPGVEKEDIGLYLTEDSLEMTVDSHGLKYHEMLNLPCTVNVETAEATYRNGVLDVVVKKKELGG